VSHYRLAAHLSLALALRGRLFWTLLDVLGPGDGAPRRLRLSLRGFFVILCVQIVYGAFTAGLHAGLTYNTFPKMHGEWIPREVLALVPAWRNAVENMATVQLAHRVLGVSILLGAVLLLAFARNASRGVRRAVGALALVALAQVFLGVATLVSRVPLALAALHQLGACFLFLIALRANHLASREVPPDRSREDDDALTAS
jgi:cytochrome c oxidase assembly protein subunit 15